MKYILMMSGSKQGVESYRAWSEKDVQTHYAELTRIRKELAASGEFVGTEALGLPHNAKLIIGGNNGTPLTDGVFPESKEFLLGYWIVDVEKAERAYEIAARISAAPGPGGVPTKMPMEVRQIMTQHRPEQP